MLGWLGVVRSWRSNSSQRHSMELRSGLCAGQSSSSTPISWSSLRTVIVLTMLPEEVWKSVVSVATEDRWFLHARRFSTWQCHSVSLCGLPLCGWAFLLLEVSTSQQQHLQLTGEVQAGQLTCWKRGILWRCHADSHWALQWGHSTANVCLWRLHGSVLDLGVAEIAESTNLKGCPHTFVYIVYCTCQYIHPQACHCAEELQRSRHSQCLVLLGGSRTNTFLGHVDTVRCLKLHSDRLGA